MKDIWIPLISALIGALAGAASSVWVTRKQLEVAFDKVKLESIQSNINKLEAVGAALFGLLINAEDEDEILRRGIGRFIKKTTIVRPYYHLLPRELCNELTALQNKVSQFIYDTKIGKPIDEDDSKITVLAIGEIEERLNDEITNTLRVWQSEVAFLTSANRNSVHQGP